MKSSLCLLAGLVALSCAALAEVAPVTVRTAEARAWIGQRVPVFVELRAPGSFAGTASFDLPPLPGTLVMRIGDPVVSSQELEGESWFVQTHEFALFSQRPGLLEVPSFPVRFSRHQGFTGPVEDVKARVPAFRVEIRRPPGTVQAGFLVTTESLELTETWDPKPGRAQVGALVKRTIAQQAQQVSGMALAAAPTTAPEGTRMYPGEPQTGDRLERGDFLGERRDTLTYLLTRAGTLELPAITYVWWNPKEEKLRSRTLPAVTFQVSSRPEAPVAGKTGGGHRAWPWLLAAAVAVCLGVRRGRDLAGRLRRVLKTLDPPDRVAARELLRACRDHDAARAVSAWSRWRNSSGPAFRPGPELDAAVLALHRHLFGPTPSGPWQPDALALAFGDHLAAARVRSPDEPAAELPSLNPTV